MLRNLICVGLVCLMGLSTFGGVLVVYSCACSGDSGIAVYAGGPICYDARPDVGCSGAEGLALASCCDITLMPCTATVVPVPGPDVAGPLCAVVCFRPADTLLLHGLHARSTEQLAFSGPCARNRPLLI